MIDNLSGPAYLGNSRPRWHINRRWAADALHPRVGIEVSCHAGRWAPLYLSHHARQELGIPDLGRRVDDKGLLNDAIDCFFLAELYGVDEFLETKAITGYGLPAA